MGRENKMITRSFSMQRKGGKPFRVAVEEKGASSEAPKGWIRVLSSEEERRVRAQIAQLYDNIVTKK
jgi:hypothetical protein